jgi:hypothetical protein
VFQRGTMCPTPPRIRKRRRVTLTDVFHFAEPDSFSEDEPTQPIYRELNATEPDSFNLSSAVREIRCFI